MTVQIRFLGTGNAFADGGRSQACIQVQAPGVSLLLDCGGTSLPAIRRALDPHDITGIAVTHLHGDHFGGIPYFVMAEHFGGRTTPLVIGGPPEIELRSEAAGRALYKDFFGKTPLAYPLRYMVLGAEPQEIGGAWVSALPVRHVPDSQPHGLRVRVGDRLIAYSGDAMWSDELKAVAKGADLFICEATAYSRPEAVHLRYVDIIARRAELDCKRIVLTHLGSDAQDHLDDMALEVASDGLTIEL